MEEEVQAMDEALDNLHVDPEDYGVYAGDIEIQFDEEERASTTCWSSRRHAQHLQPRYPGQHQDALLLPCHLAQHLPPRRPG